MYSKKYKIWFGYKCPCEGLNDFIPKQRLRGERLSKFNRNYGLGSYYLFTAEKHKEEYKTFIEKRKQVIK